MENHNVESIPLFLIKTFINTSLQPGSLVLHFKIKSGEHRDASISLEDEPNETLDCALDRDKKYTHGQAVQFTLAIRLFLSSMTNTYKCTT